MDHGVLVGTSGWMYRSWRGTVYPVELPPARWLEAYSRQFPVVEVNATFYRLTSAEVTARWASAVPSTFRFVVKGSRYLTHMRRLGEVDQGVRRFLAPLQPLGEQLTAVLWQLPPRMTLDVERLEGFLDAVAADPLGRSIQQAVEFRHPSWQTDAAYAALERRGAMTVNVSGPQLPADEVVTGGRAYVRFHGLTAGYSHDYVDDELVPWAKHLHAHRDGLAFFNNDAGGRAVKNARQLIALLGAPDVSVNSEPAQRGAVHAGQLGAQGRSAPHLSGKFAPE